MIFGINALAARSGVNGGEETYLRALVAHLALVDSENDYCLFVPAAQRSLYHFNASNFRVCSPWMPPGGRLGPPLAEQLWLPLAARRAGVQVLLCPTAAIPHLWSRPAVITVRSLLWFQPELWGGAGSRVRYWQSRLLDRWFRAAMRASARRASGVLTVSEQTRRETARYCSVDPTRIVVARHGVSSAFRPAQDPERVTAVLEQYGLRRPFLLITGAISPYKNLNRAIEGLAQVRSWSYRLPMLAVAGDDRFGCRPSLQRLAASLELEEHVRFLGPLPESVLPLLYSAATASLSLSSGESFGLPIIESMACGCPVICARRSELPEVAGDAALFVDPDRPQEVAEAIWRLATLPNVREVWVEAGLRRAKEFDWRETARITRDALVAVAEGRPPREIPGALPTASLEAADGMARGRE